MLVDSIGESVDKSLYPFFNPEMIREEGNTKFLRIQGIQVAIDPDFRIYLTTELECPRFEPEVAVHANFINFCITQDALEAQLLSAVVSEKMSKVEKKFVSTKVKAI